ncbi:ABC transporter substrate-binding protein [Halocatena pleomorpha]|uniref:ABC transporter substrate-binding protein n=1 Tax=Halocatena pleomorpha TaxID=1785090 RepID=A0A3P3RDT8_9EURY|nr:ABC transporter substrate-binding protein [Halocatena pleomorpha]RRJ31672.1 ABC transporter substrate-binding protein [Halocatena pleomorpha]
MARKHISRRQALRLLGTTGITGLAGCTGGDSERADSGSGGSSSGTVSIGVLQPISGDLKYYGEQALWGFYSGLAYKGETDPIEKASTGTRSVTIGDTTYELHVRDTQFDTDTAQTLATNLVQNEDVDLLFGCASSGAATRVIKTVSKQTGIPTLIGPAASASITADSETCAANVFRASENTAMDARSGGTYVAQQTDVDSVYLFGADYSFGKAVVNNYRAVLEAEGIEILGEKFVPQGYSEWEGLLKNAEDAGAAGIVGGFTVSTLPQLFTAFLNGDYSYRVFGGFATRITNAAMGQTLQKELGSLTKNAVKKTKLGPFTTRYHWNQYDNEINNEFVNMYTKTYGVVPDLFTAGTFTAASAIVQAVEEAGSTDGSDIGAALGGMTVVDTPKGPDGYTFQGYNNQARSEMTVAAPVPTGDAWTDSWDAPVRPSDPVARIDADTVTIPKGADSMACTL